MIWTHKKYPKRTYFGSYERDKSGERVFVLSCDRHRVTFESWQMAKSLGWVSK